MADYNIIRKFPFSLSEEQVQWVKNTIEGMSLDEKIGQLFVARNSGDDESYTIALNEKYHVGGWMGRQMPMKNAVAMTNLAQKTAKIPLLIAANFEAGGDGLITEGTNVGPNLQIGATKDPAYAGKQAYVCAREGMAVGANYAFAPVVDINYNFRNPITGTRLYSEDCNFVAEAGLAYVREAQKQGMAVSIKHFPGDGVDERDQHLVTSINSLSCEDWDKSYGMVYKKLIDAGAFTVMCGHIMQPAYSQKLNPDLKPEEIMPATLAPELLQGLLRGKLKFNGLIITDATTMNGMTIPMSRKKAVPYTIAAGCDMFLFTKNMDEDFKYMKQGYRDGILTEERLEEALIRILGLKAALKLPEAKADGSIYRNLEEACRVVGCEEHKEIERECSDKAVTLVKNLENLIPIDPIKKRRVLLHGLTTEKGYFGDGGMDLEGQFKQELEKEGFVVTIYEPGKGMEGMVTPCSKTIDNYDLIIYVADLQTKSNQTTVRIEWKAPMGGDAPSFIQDVPTLFISFANPYHLQDVPRVKTFINAYKWKEANIRAVIDKLLGHSDFRGVSPVDAFCGMWDTRL